MDNLVESEKVDRLTQEQRSSAFRKFEAEMKESLNIKETEALGYNNNIFLLNGNIQSLRNEDELFLQKETRARLELENSQKSCSDEQRAWDAQNKRRYFMRNVVCKL